MKILFLLILPTLLFAQVKTNTQADTAFNNSKRGINWVLENLPPEKKSISKEIVEKDQLVAEVKLSMEIGGVKIKSTGLANTTRVETITYYSYETLIKEGYLKELPEIKF